MVLTVILFVLTGRPAAGESMAARSPINSWIPSPEPAKHRSRNALIGGLIGATTGLVACTVISNLANDPGTGISTCDAKAYLGFALGGGALGALIGWLI